MFPLALALSLTCFLSVSLANPCSLIREIQGGIQTELALASAWKSEHIGSFIDSAVDLTDPSHLRDVVQSLSSVHQRMLAMENSNIGDTSVLHQIYDQVKDDVCSYLTETLADEDHNFNCTQENLDELLEKFKFLDILRSTTLTLLKQYLRPCELQNVDVNWLCSRWNSMIFNGTCANDSVTPAFRSSSLYLANKTAGILNRNKCTFCS